MRKIKDIGRKMTGSGPYRWLQRKMVQFGMWCCGFVAGCLAAIHMDD